MIEVASSPATTGMIVDGQRFVLLEACLFAEGCRQIDRCLIGMQTDPTEPNIGQRKLGLRHISERAVAGVCYCEEVASTASAQQIEGET